MSVGTVADGFRVATYWKATVGIVNARCDQKTAAIQRTWWMLMSEPFLCDYDKCKEPVLLSIGYCAKHGLMELEGYTEQDVEDLP